MDKPKMTPVTSSQIKEVGYDAESRTLYIKFNRGGMYSYNPITEEGYRSLMGAESLGKYFHENIKTNANITFTKL